ncbi:hypothetical protein ACOI1C_20335 [Bacillus sp. DJP31]|uniref:hypothetical protein n=1 Tax=Bacillus sp. DJP31 TaxID=3409789 RepID=UPI003BB79EF5
MDTVTLDYKQYLAFTSWSEANYKNKTQTDKVTKLTNMGVQVVATLGRGKKAEYIITIPAGFWRMLLIKSMSYTEVGADYIDFLIEGRDVLNTEEGPIVRFDSEIYPELAAKHNVEVESVKTTCIRVRNFLKEHGYIRTATVDGMKTHRVKKSFLTKEWVTGTEALQFDQAARNHWIRYYREKLSLYKDIDPTATMLPMNVFGVEIRQIYSFGMKDKLDVYYYRVAKKTVVTDNMTADINYAHLSFLETRNLAEVLNELSRRQKLYRTQKKHRDEQKVAANEQAQAKKLSKEEREAIHKQMFVIEVQREINWTPPTKEQEERLMLAIEEALSLDWDE